MMSIMFSHLMVHHVTSATMHSPLQCSPHSPTLATVVCIVHSLSLNNFHFTKWKEKHIILNINVKKCHIIKSRLSRHLKATEGPAMQKSWAECGQEGAVGTQLCSGKDGDELRSSGQHHHPREGTTQEAEEESVIQKSEDSRRQTRQLSIHSKTLACTLRGDSTSGTCEIPLECWPTYLKFEGLWVFFSGLIFLSQQN